MRYLSRAHGENSGYRWRCGGLGNSMGSGVHSGYWLLLASQGFEKFIGREGLDQDRDALRRNRVHRLRSDVAGHHDGRYVPLPRAARRCLMVISTYHFLSHAGCSHTAAHPGAGPALLIFQSQSFPSPLQRWWRQPLSSSTVSRSDERTWMPRPRSRERCPGSFPLWGRTGGGTSGTLISDRPRGTSMKNRVPFPGIERTSIL